LHTCFQEGISPLLSSFPTKRTTGVVKDFPFAEGVEAPSLPEYVWVDCGDQYKGASFFGEGNPEREGWVYYQSIR
jgi:hypothetical protein